MLQQNENENNQRTRNSIQETEGYPRRKTREISGCCEERAVIEVYKEQAVGIRQLKTKVRLTR